MQKIFRFFRQVLSGGLFVAVLYFCGIMTQKILLSPRDFRSNFMLIGGCVLALAIGMWFERETSAFWSLLTWLARKMNPALPNVYRLRISMGISVLGIGMGLILVSYPGLPWGIRTVGLMMLIVEGNSLYTAFQQHHIITT